MVSNIIKRFFCSIKVAISLLIILILGSILGTIIPQNAPEHAYINKYGEQLYYLFKLFSITDLYHSFWFIGILTLLSINILICSINRLPSIRKLFTSYKKEIDTSYILNLPLNNKIDFTQDITTVWELIKSRLHKKHYHVSVINYQPTKITIFAEKGRYSKLGAYITHLSILVILSGGIVGCILGFKEYIEINEKETINVSHTDFSLRVDDFCIEWYPESKIPKDYKTTLTIIDENKEVLTKTIEVNHPLIYKGVWFYQSSYGIAGVTGVIINIKKQNKDWQKIKINIGEVYNIPGTNIAIKIAQFLPDFAISGSKIYSRSNELNNPAIKLEVYEDKKLKFTRWVFYHFPEYHNRKDDNTGLDFRLIGFDTVQYTGLQIVKDPGVPIVWAGCGILVIGLGLSFFVFHRRIWIILQKEAEQKTSVLIGGITNKNRFDFEQEYKYIVEQIS